MSTRHRLILNDLQHFKNYVATVSGITLELDKMFLVLYKSFCYVELGPMTLASPSLLNSIIQYV